ncbi:MAG: hypothetical protein Q7S30_01880 [Candidatus Omnitrophota bacterium]|nr:hypothetical protein [Candidatus Omnitrophota bacterium]
MTGSVKIAIIICLVSAALGASFSYGADQPRMNRYEGRISYLDWVTSKMIVNGVGQMEFYIPKDVRMRKLGGWITFGNLNLLDNVSVDYYEDLSGKNIAVHINVTVV